VLALLGHDEAGRQTLDAPILIRTAEFSPDGLLRVPVGATLVRHSTSAGEVAETHTKAAGVLTALGLRPPAGQVAGPVAGAGPRAGEGSRAVTGPRLADDVRVRAALAARNDRLARFWLDERGPGAADGALAGRQVLIVDAEDTFTGMLSHQLRSLGLTVTVRPYADPGLDLLTPDAAAPDAAAPDLVVMGPGPGDPEDPDDPKMAALRTLVDGALRRGQPLLGVCLGHQILAGLLGLRMHRRKKPYQGLQREVEMFGSVRRVGFYSTFTPLSDVDFLATPYGVAALARDQLDGSVHALRGSRFAGVQFHPESVLSPDGVDVLRELVTGLLLPAAEPAYG
jgi:phenazine biosynthesis protein phzE